MATLTATSTGTGMETGTGIPTHIPTILTGQPATASCTDSSAMHYYQQVSVMRLNTCMSSTWIFVNIINHGSVIISHPLPLATSKQMQSLRNSEWPQYMHTLPVVSLFNISHEEKLAASQDALPFSLCPNTSHPLWSSSHAQTFRIKAIAVWACARLRSYVLRNLWEFTQTLLWHDRHWTLVAVGNVMWTSPVFSPFSLIQRAQLSAVPHPPVFSHVPQRRLLNSFPPLHSAHLHSLCFLHPYTYPKHLLSKIKGLEPSPKT